MRKKHTLTQDAAVPITDDSVRSVTSACRSRGLGCWDVLPWSSISGGFDFGAVVGANTSNENFHEDN